MGSGSSEEGEGRSDSAECLKEEVPRPGSSSSSSRLQPEPGPPWITILRQLSKLAPCPRRARQQAVMAAVVAAQPPPLRRAQAAAMAEAKAAALAEDAGDAGHGPPTLSSRACYTSLLTGVRVDAALLPAQGLPHAQGALCSACSTALGERKCTTCNEAFCVQCCDAIHSAHNLRLRHKCFKLPIACSPSSAVRLQPACLDIVRQGILHAYAGTSDGLCLSCEKRVGTLYTAPAAR